MTACAAVTLGFHTCNTAHPEISVGLDVHKQNVLFPESLFAERENNIKGTLKSFSISDMSSES